jgi:hypothetical protein
MSDYVQQKSLYSEVQRALWTEWDPIGLNAMDPSWSSDEYDGYAARVLRALNSAGGEHGLAEELQAIEREAMGIERPFADSLAAAGRIRAVLKWRDPQVAE